MAEEGQLLFHTKLSEEFFQRLSDLGQITDLVLTLFDGQKTRVRKMCMENASKLSLTGLQNITHHNLLELKVSNLDYGVSLDDMTELFSLIKNWDFIF